MPLSANDIVSSVMEKAIESSGIALKHPGSALKRYHVNQTADQLPDFRVRNAFYRAELERQIAEKKESERRRKEREALEEDRIVRKIEADREKLRREYFEEIEKRRILQEEAVRRQQLFAKKLEEIHEDEERKRAEEESRKQQAIIEKRIEELREAVEKRKLEEEAERRRILEHYYSSPIPIVPLPLPIEQQPKRLNINMSDWDYYKRPWNSRDYVQSTIHPDSLILEDVYFEAPLALLADVYKKLDGEKRRIKDVMRHRIIQGEL